MLGLYLTCFFETYLFRGGLSIPSILCMLSHHSLKCVKKNIKKIWSLKLTLIRFQIPENLQSLRKKLVIISGATGKPTEILAFNFFAYYMLLFDHCADPCDEDELR